MKIANASDRRPEPRHRLFGDHTALVGLFDEVLVRLEEDDRDVTRIVWRTFEAALRAHLEAEEELLFPLFRAVDPAEVEVLSDDHRRFRAKLDELAIAVDLHLVRADDARELVETLKVHSEREDEGMYAWAESHLDEATLRHLHDRLRIATTARGDRPAVDLPRDSASRV